MKQHNRGAGDWTFPPRCRSQPLSTKCVPTTDACGSQFRSSSRRTCGGVGEVAPTLVGGSFLLRPDRRPGARFAPARNRTGRPRSCRIHSRSAELARTRLRLACVPARPRHYRPVLVSLRRRPAGLARPHHLPCFRHLVRPIPLVRFDLAPPLLPLRRPHPDDALPPRRPPPRPREVRDLSRPFSGRHRRRPRLLHLLLLSRAAHAARRCAPPQPQHQRRAKFTPPHRSHPSSAIRPRLQHSHPLAPLSSLPPGLRPRHLPRRLDPPPPLSLRRPLVQPRLGPSVCRRWLLGPHLVPSPRPRSHSRTHRFPQPTPH